MSTATPPPHRAYAGIVSRLASLVIDIALLSLAGIAIRLLPEIAWEEMLNYAAPQWLTRSAGIAAALLPWAYFTISWWLAGQTVGDILLGIVVLRPDGSELSLPHAAARAAIGLLLAPLWIVGLLAILWDKHRRAWHDKVFRTVVRYRSAISRTQRPDSTNAGH